MGLYLGTNAALVGFFGFAAFFHLVLWWQSRRDTVLIALAILCVLCAAFSACLIAIATARTPAEGQGPFDARMLVLAVSLVPTAWLIPALSGARVRGFVPFVAAASMIFAAVHVAVGPLTGTVIGVDRVTTSWGEEVSFLLRDPPSALLKAFYAFALTVYGFGVVCAARLWRRDRVGGALLGLAFGGLLAAGSWGSRLDLAGDRGVYVGALPFASCVALMAVQLAREHRRRADLLTDAERRFRAIFDQTFQFTGLMTRDGTLLEANRTALDFAGLRSVDVIGKPFWETPWWTH